MTERLSNYSPALLQKGSLQVLQAVFLFQKEREKRRKRKEGMKKRKKEKRPQALW